MERPQADQANRRQFVFHSSIAAHRAGKGRRTAAGPPELRHISIFRIPSQQIDKQ
jgi:hypothetical protein